jgi:hypothetical protein
MDSKREEVQALEAAYLALLRMPFGEVRIQNQALFCSVLDVLATTLGRDNESVQNEYEAKALTSLQPAQEPLWYAVMSKEAPVINKAVRREDVAQEYADKCRENYSGVEVVPLYASPLPQSALSTDAHKVRNEALEDVLHIIHRSARDEEPLIRDYAQRLTKQVRALQSKDGAGDAEDARRFKPRELVTLNGKQLKDLLDYAWPDKDDADQADSELTLIAHDTPFKSTEGDEMPAGLYCYCTEYPEEGIILIDEKESSK